MPATSRSPRIPLSPSSPPETGLKRRRVSDSVAKPLSPQYMSVATKSYVSSYGHTSHNDEAASRPSPRSPSTSSSYPQQATQRESQPYSTPASSNSGIPGLTMIDSQDQHRDKRRKVESPGANGAELIEVDGATQPTNHNRNAALKKEESTSPSILVQDFGVNSTDESLDQLENDIGDAFLLGRSNFHVQGPRPESHLLGIYGLVPLLKTVARQEPISGEKINKLRKSYDGQIKGFGLPGRNKSIKSERDETDASPLRQSIGSGLKEFPGDATSAQRPFQTDLEWDTEHARLAIQVTPDFRAKLKKAMELQPGRVRNLEHWNDVLGHDKPRPNGPTPAQIQQQHAPQRLPNGIVRPPSHAVPDSRRQTRGKKRSYGDDSFTGYGDGYSDVEDAGAVDDYGDDEGGIRRKKRKESTAGPLTYGQMMGR